MFGILLGEKKQWNKYIINYGSFIVNQIDEEAEADTHYRLYIEYQIEQSEL